MSEPQLSRIRPVSYLPPEAPQAGPARALQAPSLAVDEPGPGEPAVPAHSEPLITRLWPLDQRMTVVCVLIVQAGLVQYSASALLKPVISLLLAMATSSSALLSTSTIVAQVIPAFLAGAAIRFGFKGTAAILGTTWALIAAALTVLCAFRTYIFVYTPRATTLLRYADTHLAEIYAILTLSAGIASCAAGILFAGDED